MSSQPVSRPRRRALAAGAAGAVLLLAACGTGEPDTAVSDTEPASVPAGRDDEAGGAPSASEAEERTDTAVTANEPTAPAAAPPPTTDAERGATDGDRPMSEPGASTEAAREPEPSGDREPAPAEPESEPTGERATTTEPARPEPEPEPTGERTTTAEPAQPEPEPEPAATQEQPAPAEPEDPPPSPEETSTAPASASVRVVDFGYGPQSVQVAPGGTVTWTFDGPTTHTVTFSGGGPDSGFVEAGGSFSASFATPGSFGYVCQLHGNMRGTVTVG